MSGCYNSDIRVSYGWRLGMSNRLQREIEEILSKVEGVPPPAPRRRLKLRWGQRLHDLLRAVPTFLSHISVGQLMLTAIAIIIIAYVFRFGNPVLARYIIIAGIALFAASLLLSFRRSNTTYQKRWRGQLIDDRGPSLAERLRMWWLRRKPPYR